MFYNSKSLKNLIIYQNYFLNNLVINMRGTFQNCESLEYLDLRYFYTPNAEIMWDMFKGCSGLTSLNISNFDKSKVTDMESMFEGCSNLKSLSLRNFNTTKVHYMNRMFRDCISLKSLDFYNISSESLGTMHQMFYNCTSLEYVNIYLLTERVQSIVEIFEFASDDFTICIEYNEKIPNIFKEILKRPNVKRDCSIKCYDTERTYVPETKLCCQKYVYNGNCVDNCPRRTKVNNNKKCEEFKFHYNYYYNYDQSNCIESLPYGYFVNDTTLNTIDKCHESCKNCTGLAQGNYSNCITCEDNKYLYFSNCYENCPNGYYDTDSEIKICNCFLKECDLCSKESDEKGLCIRCSAGYYPIYNDKSNIHFIKCLKETPLNYFFDDETQTYKKCYDSCHIQLEILLIIIVVFVLMIILLYYKKIIVDL